MVSIPTSILGLPGDPITPGPPMPLAVKAPIRTPKKTVAPVSPSLDIVPPPLPSAPLGKGAAVAPAGRSGAGGFLDAAGGGLTQADINRGPIMAFGTAFSGARSTKAAAAEAQRKAAQDEADRAAAIELAKFDAGMKEATFQLDKSSKEADIAYKRAQTEHINDPKSDEFTNALIGSQYSAAQARADARAKEISDNPYYGESGLTAEQRTKKKADDIAAITDPDNVKADAYRRLDAIKEYAGRTGKSPSELTTNDNGDVVTKQPAPSSPLTSAPEIPPNAPRVVNDATGEQMYFDGKQWLPVP